MESRYYFSFTYMLELIYYISYFFHRRPIRRCVFLSCRPFVASPTVNCPSQETQETLTPTRTVENVVLTTKGLQERNTQPLDETTVEKIGKIIN